MQLPAINYFKALLQSGEFISFISSFIRKGRLPLLERMRWEDTFRRANRKYEREVRKIMKDFFANQERIVMTNIKKSGRKRVTKDIADFWIFGVREWDIRLANEGEKFLTDIVEQEGPRVMKQLHSSVDMPVAVSFNVENPNVKAFIEDERWRMAETVNAETASNLRTAILGGMAEGEGIGVIKKRIEKVFEEAKGYRATRIARTEAIKASNMAAIETYNQSGVVTSKEWLTTNDDRTCPWCIAMAEETRQLNENFFNLGGDKTVPIGGKDQTMYFNYDAVSAPPLHPQCTPDPTTLIYTNKGPVAISEIKVNDLALTHKGRFKKVTQIFHTPNQLPEITEISFICLETGKERQLALTSNHPVLKIEGWKEIGDIKLAESIKMLWKRIYKNEFVFLYDKLIAIKKYKLKKPVTLYNFAVEEDESYVAYGIVVHNCRCTILPVVQEISLPSVSELPPPISNADTLRLANAELRAAREIEKDITDRLKTLAVTNNAKMAGLESRIKSRGSLTEKIHKESLENNWDIPTLKNENINDVLRYTMTAEEATYTDTVHNTLYSLSKEGYDIKNVKNYWGSRDYKGINNVLVHKDSGRKLELQFHTKKSLHIKQDINHPIYEKFRATDITKTQRDNYFNQMADNWKPVKPPKGALELSKESVLSKPIKEPGKIRFASEYNDPDSKKFKKANNAFFKKEHGDNVDEAAEKMYARMVDDKDFRKMVDSLADERRYGTIIGDTRPDPFSSYQEFLAGNRDRYELAVSRILTNWSGSSSSDITGIVMQMAVKDEFKLKSAAMKHLETREIFTEAKAAYKQHKKALKKFVRAQYDETQKLLASEGIDEIAVARGVVQNTKGTILEGKKVGQAVIETQPLSSYSLSSRTAGEFANLSMKEGEFLSAGAEDRFIVGGIVPKERIFSTVRTGMAVTQESEFIILGAADEMQFLTGLSEGTFEQIAKGKISFFDAVKKELK